MENKRGNQEERAERAPDDDRRARRGDGGDGRREVRHRGLAVDAVGGEHDLRGRPCGRPRLRPRPVELCNARGAGGARGGGAAAQAQRRGREVGRHVAAQEREHWLARVRQHHVGAEEGKRQARQAAAGAELDRAPAADLGAAQLALARVALHPLGEDDGRVPHGGAEVVRVGVLLEAEWHVEDRLLDDRRQVRVPALEAGGGADLCAAAGSVGGGGTAAARRRGHRRRGLLCRRCRRPTVLSSSRCVWSARGAAAISPSAELAAPATARAPDHSSYYNLCGDLRRVQAR